MLTFKKGIDVKNTINKRSVDELTHTIKRIEKLLLFLIERDEVHITDKQSTIVIKGDQLGLSEEDYLRRAVKSLTYNRAQLKDGGNPDVYQSKINMLEAIAMLRTDE